ncbi:MAG: aminopeptidase N [Gammaproteobacteria bacterium]|nr:aminopeptidase N [Gammaproteobacteria bacterium]
MKNTKQEPIYLRDYQVPDYLIETIDLTFELNEEYTKVKSLLKIVLNPLAAKQNKNLILHGEALELISIVLNNEQLSPDQYEIKQDKLYIYSVPDDFSLEINTLIKPQENTALSGLYKSCGNFCTQCEAHGFRRMTYFLDRPDVMARFTTTIIADEAKYPVLLSNGNLVSIEKCTDGKHKVKWADPFKKPCYLFALVGGDLECVEDYFTTQSGRQVTLRIYVEKGNSDQTAHAMDAVKKAMRWDEEVFGREYDLDIYMIVAVSDFNMGAMENKGLNIFNTQYILANPETATDTDFIHVESVIAHEYFHNWTGNRITCRDWFQLSLKEGLTIFRDQSFTADTTSKTVARIQDVKDLRQSQFPEDAGPLAHPVRPESVIEINNFYTATVYNKGAEIIRMQQTILGQDAFRKGMDLYFNRHDGQAVTIEDFVKAMEDASEVDLTQFRLWYSQAGTPVLKIKDEYDAKTGNYTLHIEQISPPTPGQPHKKPLHIPVKIGLLDQQGKELLHDLLHVKKTNETFHFKNLPSKPIPSLLRYFSAPVKVLYPYTEAELRLLMQHDNDLFNRWEAGQQYALHLMLKMIKDFQDNKPLHVPAEYIAALNHLLLTMQHDKWLLAEMLMLPTEKYIAEHMTVIDVDATHYVREFLATEIAKQLKSHLINLYEEHHDVTAPYIFNIQEVGKRQLKNTCLFYLMLLNDETIQLGVKQFKFALKNNMTDTIAALATLNNIDAAERVVALNAFYEQWKNHPLIVDKWLTLQASSKLPNAIKQVKALLTHPAFDIKNPNKVYALIGSFCNRNIHRFHAADGEGYEFLKECVLQLDKINPQIAARMVKPFSEWQRYDAKRQHLMHEALEQILQNKDLSKDVYEIVTKSLKKQEITA